MSSKTKKQAVKAESEIKIRDVRDQMPNFKNYKDKIRAGKILGIAVHHSGAVNPATGLSMENAQSVFMYHVTSRGWEHGGYNYFVHSNGMIEYALDDDIPAFHAGFIDQNNSLGLEFGQYWNNHYIAICLLGWFENNRSVTNQDGQIFEIPDYFTKPTRAQMKALFTLLNMLTNKYQIPSANVLGHRELRGCNTKCPGKNIDLPELRKALHAQDFSHFLR